MTLEGRSSKRFVLLVFKAISTIEFLERAPIEAKSYAIGNQEVPEAGSVVKCRRSPPHEMADVF